MAYNTALAMAPYNLEGAQWADFESGDDRMDFHRSVMAIQAPAAENRCDSQTVEMALDPELLATFCRRSRRRLRDVQTACQASVKLDRTRGVLRVSGPESSIQAVRRQLASLAGPRRTVPAAVWAELMRTRKMNNSAQATVARLQEESGCRIHIERSQQEVRLFGPGEAVAVADRLLEDLAKQCTEETVPLRNDVALSSSALEALAHRCRITLRMEEGQIVVLGMQAAVAEGGEQLRKYLADPAAYEPPMSDDTTSSEHGFVSGDDADKNGIVVWEGADRGIPSHPKDTKPGPMMMMPPPQVHRTNSMNSQKSQKSDGRKSCARCCPSCGASRFCGSCGALTGFQMGGWDISTASGGSDRSKPTTPDSPDVQQGSQQWYPYMQQMVPQMQQAAMNMGQHGMVPVCMVPNGPGGATMMPAGMIMLPASAVSADGGWMQNPDGSSLWVPSQQGTGGSHRSSVDQSSLPGLHETLAAYAKGLP